MAEANEDKRGMELGAMLRALRRRADLSQRELAQAAGVPKSTVARIEAGESDDTRFRTFEKLVLAAGGRVTVDGGRIGELPDGPLDAAFRCYPAHLDVRAVRKAEDWWGAWWASLQPAGADYWMRRLPPYTFDLDRGVRDGRRQAKRLSRAARIRRFDGSDGPFKTWRWVAEVPDETESVVVGELRARLRPPWPEGFLDDEEIVLDGVVVVPAARRQGIGRRLVAALRAEVADPAGLAVSVVVVMDPVAESFLRGCGFTFEAARPALWRARPSGAR